VILSGLIRPSLPLRFTKGGRHMVNDKSTIMTFYTRLILVIDEWMCLVKYGSYVTV